MKPSRGPIKVAVPLILAVLCGENAMNLSSTAKDHLLVRKATWALVPASREPDPMWPAPFAGARLRHRQSDDTFEIRQRFGARVSCNAVGERVSSPFR